MSAKSRKGLTIGTAFAKSASKINSTSSEKKKNMKILDAIPFHIVIIMCLTIGLAPFVPEPHVVEKLRMLFSGNLHRLVDIGDLLMHGSPWILLVLKLISLAVLKRAN